MYFYNNIFLYNTGSNYSLPFFELKGCASFFEKNTVVFILIFYGLYDAFIKRRKIFLCIIPSFFTMLGFLNMRTAYPYYHFILCSYMPFGYMAMVDVMQQFMPNQTSSRINRVSELFAVLVFCVIFSLSSSNTYLLLKPKKTMPQYVFADYINKYDDRTVLNFGCLDIGMYTVLGTIPTVPFYCQFNVALEEMYKEQQRYIAEGVTNFVVSKENELVSDNYCLVCIRNFYHECRQRSKRVIRPEFKGEANRR